MNSNIKATIKNKYIDLGLPSGNLWCVENIEGLFTWEETASFKPLLPRLTDFSELYDGASVIVKFTLKSAIPRIFSF